MNTPGLVFEALVPLLSVIIEVDPKLNVLVLVRLVLPSIVIAHAEFEVPALKMPELVKDDDAPDIVIVDAESAVNVAELPRKLLFPLMLTVEPHKCIFPGDEF